MNILIKHIAKLLEKLAPSSLQENYDNAGLIIGNADTVCTGVLCTLDVTEAVVQEAINKKCNLIVAHHPIIFNGLKRLNGYHYVERIAITALKNDISIYAIHTNLDNVLEGVNKRIADALGLIHQSILLSKHNTLKKIFTFVPISHVETVTKALFEAKAGQIGNYSECSFQTQGTGTFKAQLHSNPFVGKVGEQHKEAEVKIEAIFPAVAEKNIIQALLNSHPYETPAYDIVPLSNPHPNIGAGLLGKLPNAVTEQEWLQYVQQTFQLKTIRHTAFTGKKIEKVALCGGAGSFLIPKAIQFNADVYLTADIKYHDFFEADGKLLLMDIGHWESEQFTIDLLHDFLSENFRTFAVLKTGIKTNPVQYYF